MDEKFLKFSLGCLLVLTLTYAESSTKLSINENAYQYGGEYTDSESHLQYLNARYYDVETMRFISRDTYQNKSNVFDNTYNYGADNPITNEDPSGHCGIGVLLEQAVSNIGQNDYNLSLFSTLAPLNINTSPVTAIVELPERDVEAELAAAKAEVIKLQRANKFLNNELIRFKLLHERSMQQIAELSDQNKYMKTENDELIEEFDKQEVENKKLYTTSKFLIENNNTLRIEKQQIANENQYLRNEKATLFMENFQLTTKVDQLNQQNEALIDLVGFKKQQDPEIWKGMYI